MPLSDQQATQARRRKLFCQLGPQAYFLSVKKQRLLRRFSDLFCGYRFAKVKAEPLPILVHKHKSLIRRTLGDVDMRLQENKAVNLAISAPKVDGILIRPGEVFSFWRLVGSTSARKGYKEGLTISSGETQAGIGGGMCQFTNLLHWMALHSPLEVVEHHHHDGMDLFPDFGRVVPFGCGTSICFNYLDYQLRNSTDLDFQFVVYSSGTHLCGELRASEPLSCSYHVSEEDAHFQKEGDQLYRVNTICVNVVDKVTGNLVEKRLVKRSHARVMYDHSLVDQSLVKH